MLNDLRAWRAERLLSTRRLSALSGVGHRTIVQIEHGRQTPTFVTIEKLARTLQVEPQQVTEFATALEVRSVSSRVVSSEATSATPAAATIACISSGAAFLTITRRLFGEGRYGILAMIGMTVTAEQIASMRPAVVVLDLGAAGSPMLDLIRAMRQNPVTAQLPIVVTGRSMSNLLDSIMDLGADERLQVIPVPIDAGLRGLSGAVATLVDVASTPLPPTSDDSPNVERTDDVLS